MEFPEAARLGLSVITQLARQRFSDELGERDPASGRTAPRTFEEAGFRLDEQPTHGDIMISDRSAAAENPSRDDEEVPTDQGGFVLRRHVERRRRHVDVDPGAGAALGLALGEAPMGKRHP